MGTLTGAKSLRQRLASQSSEWASGVCELLSVSTLKKGVVMTLFYLSEFALGRVILQAADAGPPPKTQ